MVLVLNLKADGARARGTGPVGPWPIPTSRPPRSRLLPGHRLGALAGSAKLRKATVVSAGEGS